MENDWWSTSNTNDKGMVVLMGQVFEWKTGDVRNFPDGFPLRTSVGPRAKAEQLDADMELLAPAWAARGIICLCGEGDTEVQDGSPTGRFPFELLATFASWHTHQAGSFGVCSLIECLRPCLFSCCTTACLPLTSASSTLMSLASSDGFSTVIRQSFPSRTQCIGFRPASLSSCACAPSSGM